MQTRRLHVHRPVILLFLAALALRLLCAVVVKGVIIPRRIFPAYYFGDTKEYQTGAFELLKNGIFSPVHGYSGGHVWYMRIEAFFYTIFGPHTLVMMAVNASLSAAVIFLIYKMGLFLFNNKIALSACALYAVYPSLIFFSSLNLRDPWIAFFSLLACTSVLAIMNEESRLLWIPVFFFSLLTASLLRPQTALFFLVTIVLLSVWLLAVKKFGQAINSAALIISCWVIYKLTTLPFISVPDIYPATPAKPVAVPVPAPAHYKLMAKVMEFRYGFLYANEHTGIPPATLLYPGWRFHSIPGLVLMEIKLVLSVLFLPLPFIYPDGGRIARVFQGIENTAFIAAFILFALGLYAAVKAGKNRAPHLFTFIYLAVFIGIFSFFCPDLGSATRYKLQYIPLMLPFMAMGWDIISGMLRKRAAR
ncbi:MAG: hypothetical protein M0018_12390 [Nitrospiraceae bacterium]|nr:hypothetical protein [Nitrospiraceae bacterium]